MPSSGLQQNKFAESAILFSLSPRFGNADMQYHKLTRKRGTHDFSIPSVSFLSSVVL